MTNSVIVLESEPGIQRDGTPYDSKKYIDGQWVRFYRGRPRKIGGYRLIDQGTGTLIRTVYNYDNPNRPDSPKTIDTYLGRSDSVVYETFDLNGNAISGEVDRTPGVYYIYTDINNLWTFETFIESASPTDPLIVAHVAQNADDVSNSEQGPIFWGNTSGNLPLEQIFDEVGPVVASGGIVFAPPILIAYGNNGLIRWSKPGEITAEDSWTTAANQIIANTKIIKMLLTRSSGQPQLLAWTLGSLLSLSYTPDEATPIPFFIVSTVDNKITVMSPNSIIGYANQFFWIGLDQFYFFNGIVQTLPNTVNADYFFDNVNLSQRSKIWAEIVSPRLGMTEIWWHFPMGTSLECNHALIYHIELKIWYDTTISRSAGAPANIFPYPMMADNVLTTFATRIGPVQTYPLWMHEFKEDKEISPSNITAIDSYYEGHIYDFFEGNPANNRAMRNLRVEPDFRMSGSMTLTVNNRFFPADTASGKVIPAGPYTFDINTQKIDAITSQGRLVSFRFESNQIGGSFQMGKTLLNYNIGDGRTSGAGTAGTGS